MVEVSVECKYCNKSYPFAVDEEGLKRWEEGELIQDALPSLEVWNRELLISRTCNDCWNGFFEDDDDGT